MKKVLAALVAVLCLCTNANAFASVQVDYDHTLDFSNYHTYAWGKVEAKDSLWSDRIRQSVDQQLQAKGWRLVTDNADVTVLALAASQTQQQEQTFYSGSGFFWGGMNGIATTQTYTELKGLLVISLFDGKSKKLAWRGTANGGLSQNPDKNIGKLNKAVQKMFKDFPPKK